MENEKKVSIISKIFYLIKYFFVFLLPSLKLISLNKYLNKGYKIEKDKWFIKQKQRNLILAFLLILPMVLTVYKTYALIDNDVNLKTRIENLSDKGIIDKVKSLDDLVRIEKSDALAIKESKFETQARFLASGIVLFIGLTFQIMLVIVILRFHPLIADTEKLKKLLVGSVIKKEEIDKKLVFATPIGFIIDITGMNAEDIVRQKSIWDALNLTVKDFSRDPEQRSLVFFRKEFELQDTYIYDKL